LKPHLVKESVKVGRLREKIGEQAMENELLREKIACMEQNRPLTLLAVKEVYNQQ